MDISDANGSAAMDVDNDAADGNETSEQNPVSQRDHQIPTDQSGCHVNAACHEAEQHLHEASREQQIEPINGAETSLQETEQRRRDQTPEELANLGKAVDMVQARSCQLSPSLLTLGQAPSDMDSPARDAFERGRRD